MLKECKSNLCLIYYIYILFDYLGIPRYVGKGQGKRWEGHKPTDKNQLKAAFIRRTLAVLEEVPRIRIREHLSENEAFATEIALIAALGRIDLDTGCLTNMTDGGDGLSGHRHSSAAIHLMSLAQYRRWAKMTPEERSESARQREAAKTPEEKREFGEKVREGHLRRSTPEERSERARHANSFVTEADRKNWWTKIPLEERSAAAKRRAASKTPEEWRKIARKRPIRTPEQWSESARKREDAKTPEQRSEDARKREAAKTQEDRNAINIKISLARTFEQRSESQLRGWITRRKNQAGGPVLDPPDSTPV